MLTTQISSSSPFRDLIPVIKDWMYFQTYNRGPLPKPTLDVLIEYYRNMTYAPGVNYAYWSELAESGRNLLALYLGTTSANIAFFKNATEALSLFLDSYQWKFGYEALTSFDEYPQYLGFLERVEQKGIRVRIVPNRKEIIRFLDKKTQLVFLSHVSWRDGLRIDLIEIINACHSHGCVVLVDAVQSLGCFRIETDLAGVDFLIGNTRKWLLGTEGLGFLYINPIHISSFERRFGRFASSVREDIFLNTKSRNLYSTALKLEPGGRNKPAAIAVGRSIDFLATVGFSEIAERITNLVAYATKGAENLSLKVISPHQHQEMSGILAIELDSEDTRERLLNDLRKQGVLATGYANILVFGIHFFNTKEEIDLVLAMLPKILKL